MALTEIKTSGIADDAITTDKLANAINTERAANTAKVSLESDAVTGAKIADDAIDSEHYTDGSIDTAHIADNAVTTAKLASNVSFGELAVTGDVHFNSNTNAGKDVYWDESASELQFSDTTYATFGTGEDLKIHHDASNTYITNSTGQFAVQGDDLKLRSTTSPENYVVCTHNGAVDLYHNGTKKLETTADGVQIPSTTLEISSTACHIDLMESGVTDSHHRIRQNAGNLYIQKLNNDKSTATDRLILDGGTSNLQLESGDFILAANGAGIQFYPHAGGNKLDDYEEGTWTPTFFIGGDQAVYSTGGQQGRYTKTGRLIYCSFIIDLSSKGSGASSSQVIVSGLPFTSTNDSGDRMGGYLTYVGAMTGLTSGVFLYNTTNTTSLGLWDCDGTNHRSVKGENVENSTHIRGQCWYHC